MTAFLLYLFSVYSLGRSEKYKSCNLHKAGADSEPQDHSTDFKTVFGIMVEWFVLCKIRQMYFTESGGRFGTTSCPNFDLFSVIFKRPGQILNHVTALKSEQFSETWSDDSSFAKLCSYNIFLGQGRINARFHAHHLSVHFHLFHLFHLLFFLQFPSFILRRGASASAWTAGSNQEVNCVTWESIYFGSAGENKKNVPAIQTLQRDWRMFPTILLPGSSHESSKFTETTRKEACEQDKTGWINESHHKGKWCQDQGG